MASKRSRKWPRYEVGREDYIFALGVVAANFNRLEGFLRFHFATHIELSGAAVDQLFAKLENADRVQLILNNLSNRRYKAREAEAVEYFLKGFLRCAQNRNILLHAQALPVVEVTKGKPRVIFYKNARKPPYDSNRYLPSISELRAIADTIHAFAEYGLQLGHVIHRAYVLPKYLPGKFVRGPLPRRPPLPRLLAPKPFEIPSPPKGQPNQP